jgi:hypothetical protein
MLLFVMPLVFGLVAGNCHQEGKPGIRFTFATRPVTDSFLAAAILRNCLLSLILTWAVWLVGCGLIVGLVSWSGEQVIVWDVLWPQDMTVLRVAAMGVIFLLISWTFTTLMASLVAAGRAWLIVTVLFLFFGFILALALLKTYVSPHQFETIATVWSFFSGTLFLLLTVGLFVVAARLRLFSVGLALGLGTGWLLATVAVVAGILPDLQLPQLHDRAFLWQCIGSSSLSVAAFAALPLAIFCNRHR